MLALPLMKTVISESNTVLELSAHSDSWFNFIVFHDALHKHDRAQAFPATLDHISKDFCSITDHRWNGALALKTSIRFFRVQSAFAA